MPSWTPRRGDILTEENAMLIRSTILAVSAGTLLLGCGAEPDDNEEIIDNLIEAGFAADDITIVDGLVYVGRDAEVSLEASREMLAPLDVTEEQYRTTNLVGSNIRTICIDPSSAFTGDFSTGIDLAIENYNDLGLSFSLARGSGCDATIRAVLKRNLVGGSAGFPKGGKPYRTINIGDGLAPFGLDVIEHVITHETVTRWDCAIRTTSIGASAAAAAATRVMPASARSTSRAPRPARRPGARS